MARRQHQVRGYDCHIREKVTSPYGMKACPNTLWLKLGVTFTLMELIIEDVGGMIFAEASFRASPSPRGYGMVQADVKTVVKPPGCLANQPEDKQ